MFATRGCCCKIWTGHDNGAYPATHSRPCPQHRRLEAAQPLRCATGWLRNLQPSMLQADMNSLHIVGRCVHSCLSVNFSCTGSMSSLHCQTG